METLHFSKWASWDDREKSLHGLEYPGIYAIAIYNERLSDKEFSYIEEIRYFGMTNSRAGLKGRLSQFNNTLRDIKGPGHGGAERFRYDYEDGNTLAKNLYVSVCSFKCETKAPQPNDLKVMGSVARAEYMAWAEYMEKFGKLPKYNDKKTSPKRKPHN